MAERILIEDDLSAPFFPLAWKRYRLKEGRKLSRRATHSPLAKWLEALPTWYNA